MLIPARVLLMVPNVPVPTMGTPFESVGPTVPAEDPRPIVLQPAGRRGGHAGEPDRGHHGDHVEFVRLATTVGNRI